MKITSNFKDGEHRFSILDLTIEEIDNIRKSLYYTGWFNNDSPIDIIKSVQTSFQDLCTAIEQRDHYVNGVLTDPSAKISKP